MHCKPRSSCWTSCGSGGRACRSLRCLRSHRRLRSTRQVPSRPALRVCRWGRRGKWVLAGRWVRLGRWGRVVLDRRPADRGLGLREVAPGKAHTRGRRRVIRPLSPGIPRGNPVTQPVSLVTHRDPPVSKDRREDTVRIHHRSDCHPSTPPNGDDDDFASALSDRALCARGRTTWLTPGQQLVKVRNRGFRTRISLPRSWRTSSPNPPPNPEASGADAAERHLNSPPAVRRVQSRLTPRTG